MKIHENKIKCYELAEKYFHSSSNRILNSWSIKKTLNDFLDPDHHVVFENNDFILPVVIKENIATFFGGDLPYNEDNIIKSSKDLNYCIDALQKRGVELKLTSIQNDCISYLDDAKKHMDVPYNQNWFIENFYDFNFEEHVKNCDSKTRKRINRARQFLHDDVTKVYIEEKDYSTYRDKIFQSSVNFFELRNKKNAWADKKYLYDSLLKEFSKFENINCILTGADGKMLGSYKLVISEEEALLAFSNSYDIECDYVTYALYIDAISTLQGYVKQHNLKNIFFNASRGNFGYKKKFGFKPIPMYALVDAHSWQVKYNQDLSNQETLSLYKRDFGAFTHEKGKYSLHRPPS